MSDFERSDEEVRAVMQRFVATSDRCAETRDWRPLADFFAEDAVYRYTMGAAGTRIARGRDEVRRLVMERDMMGFDGWTFPYEWICTDGNRVITKWWNQAPARKPDGSPYRVVGNSNIRLDRDLQIAEMQDNFDLAALLAMIQKLNREGKTRIHIPEAEDAEGL